MIKTRQLILITVLASLLSVGSLRAQHKINLVRYDDDFTSLKNDRFKKGLDNLKYLQLFKNFYISVGGELREQLQYYNNINFGDIPPTYADTEVTQLWHRLMVHTNIELGRHFRVFIQLSNTARFFNDNPIIPEIEENQLSLHQAFAELKLTNWNFRLGFQEMYFGNHRVITVREGPNTRQSFDGLTVKRKFKNGSIDFFAVSKVIARQYAFDDDSMHDGLLGIYGSQYYLNHKFGLDYYLINFQSRDRKYNYQSGFENRRTCGIRLFSNLKSVNFEFEGAYQTGKFNGLTIEAYNVLADINVMALPAKKGIIGIAANLASGDRDGTDKKLNTYNLLYAKPAYGLAAPIGATNMFSLYPYIKINPIQKLNILAQAFFLARQSNQDGTYSPGMVQNRPTPNVLFGANKKNLGQYYVLETNYQQDKNLSFSLDASYFKAGSYPETTGKGDDILYLSFKSTFKF